MPLGSPSNPDSPGPLINYLVWPDKIEGLLFAPIFLSHSLLSHYAASRPPRSAQAAQQHPTSWNAASMSEAH